MPMTKPPYPAEFKQQMVELVRAVRLWRRLGLEVVGTLPGAFRHRQLCDLDAYVMFTRVAN
jgi:hypothetical protein